MKLGRDEVLIALHKCREYHVFVKVWVIKMGQLPLYLYNIYRYSKLTKIRTIYEKQVPN